MNAGGDPLLRPARDAGGDPDLQPSVDTDDAPLRPPRERRAAFAMAWIAATLLVIGALVFAWDRPAAPDVRAASMALPSLPSLPDPAAPSAAATRDDADASVSAAGASGAELIEVCGVGWVPPDASGAADRAAIAGDRDVLASQRALLDALRRRDGEVGEAMATVLELQGVGRDNAAGTPLQALALCSGAASGASRAAADCAARDDDRRGAAALVERLAKMATATREPRVYALALQQCETANGQGSCALLSDDQWARIDDGNALPWLHILQRARDRNDPARVEEALYHIGAAERYEEAAQATAGRVAEHAGASDVDLVAAVLAATDAFLAAARRVDSTTALADACKAPSLADANRRQACDRAAETLAERSDSLHAVSAAAALGRRLGWPAERVQALQQLQLAATDEATSTMRDFGEVATSCGGARRLLASFARRARIGEVQVARAWAAAHGSAGARLALPSPPASSAEVVRSEPAVLQAAADATADKAAVAAAPVAEPAPSSAAPAPETPASAIRYSAAPPPDR